MIDLIKGNQYKKPSSPTRAGSSYPKIQQKQYETLLNQQQQYATLIPVFKALPFCYKMTYLTKGILGCLGGFLIHLVIGSLYQWGLLNPYVTSYFINHGQPQLNLKDTIVIFPIMMFCIGTTMNMGLYLGAKYGYIKVVVGSITISSTLVFLSTLSEIFVLTYAIGFGVFVGLSFMIPMRVCNDYFPNKQTFVNGFILIGTGLGSVVFGLFSVNYLNPSHIPPRDGLFIGQLSQISDYVPNNSRVLALFYLITGLLGALLLYPVTMFNQFQKNRMDRTIISKSLLQETDDFNNQCQSYFSAFTSKVFYFHILIIVLGSCGNLFINTNYKSYANQFIGDDDFLILVGVIGSIANGFSRFPWSVLFQKIGYKLVMLALLSINIISLATVRFTRQIWGLYMFSIFTFNAVLGGLLVVAPTYSALVFGKDMGPKIFGFFWCSFALGNFLQYIYLVILQPHIGLNNIIYICLGMNILNILIIIFFNFQAKWSTNLKYFQLAPMPKTNFIPQNNHLLVYSVLNNRMKESFQSSYINKKKINKGKKTLKNDYNDNQSQDSN